MRFLTSAMSLALLAAVISPASGQPRDSVGSGIAEQALSDGARLDRFTFVVFYRNEDAATKGMIAAVDRVLAGKDNAGSAVVQLTSPAEKPLVDRLGIGRAPMPLCVAFAPNGAVTGVFRKASTADDMAKAFVTPTMSRCMKAMQDGKLVLVCVQTAPRTPMPAAVKSLRADPDFTDRTATFSLDTTDPAERDFLDQLEIDADNSADVATVVLAPPGVLVGKFPSTASADDLVAELNAAGKCCDDPNCKHQKSAGRTGTSSASKKTSTINRK